MANEEKYFEVIGAGNILLGDHDDCRCGGQYGFEFGVSWGRHGYTGGVLSRSEALRLADHIIETMGEKKVSELRKKLNSEQKAQVSDTRDDAQGGNAGKQKT